jgi:hypothetical protein
LSFAIAERISRILSTSGVFGDLPIATSEQSQDALAQLNKLSLLCLRILEVLAAKSVAAGFRSGTCSWSIISTSKSLEAETRSWRSTAEAPEGSRQSRRKARIVRILFRLLSGPYRSRSSGKLGALISPSRSPTHFIHSRLATRQVE